MPAQGDCVRLHMNIHDSPGCHILLGDRSLPPHGRAVQAGLRTGAAKRHQGPASRSSEHGDGILEGSRRDALRQRGVCREACSWY